MMRSTACRLLRSLGQPRHHTAASKPALLPAKPKNPRMLLQTASGCAAAAAAAVLLMEGSDCEGAPGDPVQAQESGPISAFFRKLTSITMSSSAADGGGNGEAGQPASKQGKLQRTLSGGVARRDLIVCRGGTDDLAGQYDMLGRLGRGGFGTVQKAKHKITGLLRAIKTIAVGVDENGRPNELPSSEAEWDRIMAEVQALMALDHPNIVRLYEYYKDEHALYLVEEYCSGGTLEAAIERAPCGRFSADDAALALRQMLRALVCCHAHGLAHREYVNRGANSDPSHSLASC